MSDSFEMKDLSNLKAEGEGGAQHDSSTPSLDNTLSLWSWISAISMTILAAVLTIFPQFLLFISQTVSTASNDYRASLTPLESFLATHLGLWLFALAASLVLNIPHASPPVTRRVTEPEHPLLMPFTFTALFSAFLSFNTTSVGSLSFFYFLLTGTTGLWGLWALVFTGTSRISKKTGADKRTSAFIFGNKSAASQQKKKWKEERRKS